MSHWLLTKKLYRLYKASDCRQSPGKCRAFLHESKNTSDDELEDLTAQGDALQRYYDQLEDKSLEAQGYMNDYADVISDTYNAYKEAKAQSVITDSQKQQLKAMESFMTDYMKIATDTSANTEKSINNLFVKSQFIDLKEQHLLSRFSPSLQDFIFVARNFDIIMLF